MHKREDMFSMLHITDEDKQHIHRIAAAPNTSELLLQCVLIISAHCSLCADANRHACIRLKRDPEP